MNLVHPAGLPPADSSFEAKDDCNFTTDAEMVGRLGFAPSSRRLRAGTSLSKFATLMTACKDRDTKAELNRRGEACEVLAGTGILHRGIRIPSALNPEPGLVAVRKHFRPCGASADAPDSLGKWTGMSVARRLFRFGRPACLSQHLCPKNGVPCEIRTHLRGFADRCLNCSANGTGGSEAFRVSW